MLHTQPSHREKADGKHQVKRHQPPIPDLYPDDHHPNEQESQQDLHPCQPGYGPGTIGIVSPRTSFPLDIELWRAHNRHLPTHIAFSHGNRIVQTHSHIERQERKEPHQIQPHTLTIEAFEGNPIEQHKHEQTKKEEGTG